MDRGVQGATEMEVACGTLALLDQLAIALVNRGHLTQKDCGRIVVNAIESLKKSDDKSVRGASSFLEAYYKKATWDRTKKKKN